MTATIVLGRRRIAELGWAVARSYGESASLGSFSLLQTMFSTALARLSVVRPIGSPASFSSFLADRTFSTSPLVQAARVKKYKLKTHHAAAKRWKALASGLFKRVNISLSSAVNQPDAPKT